MKYAMIKSLDKDIDFYDNLAKTIDESLEEV